MIRSQVIPRKIFIELVEKRNTCEALCLRHVLFMVSEKPPNKLYGHTSYEYEIVPYIFFRFPQLQIKTRIKGICYRPVIGMF